MKITLNVFWKQYDWEEKGEVFVISCDPEVCKVYENEDRIFIRSIEVDLPDISAPSRDQIVRAKVAALQSERQSIMAESQQKLNKIDDKIKQLSCIEYKEVAL